MDNIDLEMDYPPGWTEGIERWKSNMNIRYDVSYENVDTMDEDDIMVVRSDDHIKAILANIKKLYNDAIRF